MAQITKFKKKRMLNPLPLIHDVSGTQVKVLPLIRFPRPFPRPPMFSILSRTVASDHSSLEPAKKICYVVVGLWWLW